MQFDSFILTLLAQADIPAPPASPDASINSVWDFVVKGGPVMVPIGICSLIALTIIIERLITLRRRNVIPPKFVSGLKDAMAGGDSSRALAFCKTHRSTVASVFAAGIKRLGDPVETVERHVQEAGMREIVKLRKNLRGLSVIGSVAPLLGLLGTITGMITAFQTVAASGEALGRTELLAKGIYEAMITTAAGLIVAIPVLICYHWLAAKIDAMIFEIDHMTVEFIEDYARPSKSKIDAPLKIDGNGHLGSQPVHAGGAPVSA